MSFCGHELVLLDYLDWEDVVLAVQQGWEEVGSLVHPLLLLQGQKLCFLHQSQLAPSDHAARLLRKRHIERDKIRCCQQFI